MLARILFVTGFACVAVVRAEWVFLEDVATQCGGNVSVAATSTCGEHPDPTEFYFGEWGLTAISTFPTENCSTSSVDTRHPAEFILDEDNTTWWQSAPGVQDVNITVHLPSMTLLTQTTLLFRSYSPRRARLLGSSDGGATFREMKQYAGFCPGRSTGFRKSFSKPADLQGNLDVHCVLVYEMVQDMDNITYSPATRVNGLHELVTNATYRNIVMVDVLRLEMTLPYAGRGGDPSVHDPRLIYYGIYDWHIEGLVDSNAATMCNACQCNNHSRMCFGQTPDFRMMCENCSHNTAGESCSECLPGFYLDPMFAVDDPSICPACECNNHASLCEYNVTSSRPVCNLCSHNTTGDSCELCMEGFYHDPDIAIDDVRTCVACPCNGSACALNLTVNRFTCFDCYPADDDSCRPCRSGFSLSSNESSVNDMLGCLACPCNDHADQCYFNQTTGRIACLACRHNTAGVRCEECSARYRRDNDVALNDTDACIPVIVGQRSFPFNSDPILKDDYKPFGIGLAVLVALSLIIFICLILFVYMKQRKVAYFDNNTGETRFGRRLFSILKPSRHADTDGTVIVQHEMATSQSTLTDVKTEY